MSITNDIVLRNKYRLYNVNHNSNIKLINELDLNDNDELLIEFNTNYWQSKILSITNLSNMKSTYMNVEKFIDLIQLHKTKMPFEIEEIKQENNHFTL